MKVAQMFSFRSRSLLIIATISGGLLGAFQNCGQDFRALPATSSGPSAQNNEIANSNACSQSVALGAWTTNTSDLQNPQTEILVFRPDCTGSSKICGNEFEYPAVSANTGKVEINIKSHNGQAGCPPLGRLSCDYRLLSDAQNRKSFEITCAGTTPLTLVQAGATPAASPTPIATPTPAPTATPSPAPSATPSPTATPTPIATPVPTPTPYPGTSLYMNHCAACHGVAPSVSHKLGRSSLQITNAIASVPSMNSLSMLTADEIGAISYALGGTAPTGASVKKMYLSTSVVAANLGSMAAYDAVCANDPAKPAAVVSAKAMLIDGVSRRACSTLFCSGGISENLDWVLKPSTYYQFQDGTMVGSTNTAAILRLPANPTSAMTNLAFWTGLNAYWLPSGFNCKKWSSAESGTAEKGITAIFSSERSSNLNVIFSDGYAGCETSQKILCVEQ